MIGCLGCGIAPNMTFLNLMRALTGIGGGGLITMGGNRLYGERYPALT
jgi:MFS family permease